MADSSDLKLDLLDELCDKLDKSGIEGNIIERDSRGRPYVNIWYGSYEDRELQASQMFTVVVTGDSLYWNPHGCYEITPPGKYLDYFKDTFSDCRKSSGYYVWIMTGDKIIRTIKFLFNREKMERKKENNVANWENEKRILEDATKSINLKKDTCFVADMRTRADTQEPVILVQGPHSHYIFEIYYDYKNKKYSVVPRGALKSIADGSQFVRCSIHNGFGFSKIPHCFLESIYNKWKDEQRSEIKKENNMNINIIDKEFSLLDRMLLKLKKYGIKYRMSTGKNGIYDPEKMIVSTTSKTGIETDICLLRSIPNSESTRFAYEVNWINVPSYILATFKIDRVKEYEFSDEVIIDILLIERELDAYTAFKTFVGTNKLPTIRAVDVIFNDPATIIIWADGSKTVVKAENEKFDPEKGLAMAISKKVLGNKHDYYEVFKRYVGRYKKKQGKKNKNKENK